MFEYVNICGESWSSLFIKHDKSKHMNISRCSSDNKVFILLWTNAGNYELRVMHFLLSMICFSFGLKKSMQGFADLVRIYKWLMFIYYECLF